MQFLIECSLHLTDLGMPTGLLAYLDTGQDTTVALRADIDAVDTDEGPKHLWGHNYHAAALLGAADMLSRMGKELRPEIPVSKIAVHRGPLMVRKTISF